MSDKSFSISEAINQGWQTFSKNLSTYAIALAVSIVLYTISAVFSDGKNDTQTALESIGALISFALSTIVTLGYIKVLLKLLEDKKPEISDFFYFKSGIFSYIVASILLTPLIFIGYILLIIPGIILSIRFSLVSYFIADKNMGPIDAIGASWNATKGQTLQLFLFGLANLGLNILGLLALGIGLFITVPVSQTAMAYVYKKLLAEVESNSEIKDASEVEVIPAA